MSVGSPAVAVGIDVGGTKLVAAALDASGAVVARERTQSPVADAEALLDTVAGLARRVGPGLPVGIGIAGLVTRDGVLRYGPNLDVRDVAVKGTLQGALGVAVEVVNDATAAVLGEARRGAAIDAEDVILLTLGTGVGGGLLVGGHVVEGARGYGGELGHITIVAGGRRCPCGNDGCLEAYASGTAIGAFAREALAAGETSELLAAADPLDGKAVSAAAQAGDALARRILGDVGRWLGIGLASLVNALDPELIVIGGGASLHTAGFVLPAASAAMAPRLLGAGTRPAPPIVLAQLGDDAGVVGAGLLAAERHAGAAG